MNLVQFRKDIPDEIIKKLDYKLNPEIKISKLNWKDFRNAEAIRQYPVGTLIQCGQSWAKEPDYNNFFRVRKITPTGILVADELRLDEADRDCDQLGGWIDYDPKSARVSGEKVNFFPFLEYYDWVVEPYDKNRGAVWMGLYCIDWCGSKDSGYHAIDKFKIEKNGLVRALMGGTL